MKKTITALSVLCLAGGAFAQSSVTLFGVMDANYAWGSGDGPAGSSRQQISSGSNTPSRWGIRGTEDLGGGLAAGFWLESQVFVDSGAGQPTNTNNQASGGTTTGAAGSTFARRSTVSLSGGFGEVRAGRDFTAHYRNRVELDPFTNAGVGSIQPFVGSIAGVTSTRASNMVGYFLPANLAGFYGQYQHYLGENTESSPGLNPNADDGDGNSIRVGWAGGALNVSLAAGRTDYAKTAALGNITSVNAGVTYAFSAAKVMVGYFRDKVDALVPVRADGYSIGTVVPVGVGEIKAALSNYGTDAGLSPETVKLSLGYVHNLSKRTALYGTYARVRNSGGANSALNAATTSPNQASSGVDLGVRHFF